MDNTVIEHSLYCDERNSFSSSEYNVGFSVGSYIDGGRSLGRRFGFVEQGAYRPFGSLQLAVRALAWALHQDGYPIECRPATHDTWSPVIEPRFDADTCCRVMPKAGMPVYDLTPESDDDF
ncbi:hypothetical protein [Caballeronia sordidicola]|uniref:Uncharacterized protein n=1 Tax=Caballeronia sordidicola TaxID=196367 RepID=A0A242MBV4_CABSO|nr:hypothetical protein [Caballeronia sordidicola]OTP68692.1 hypothetical protein PAMC26577_32565 [Caballeronia sordidicola]